MTGLVSKWLINNSRDPASMESWLSDMAGQGLLLRRISGLNAYFEQTMPYEMEYRIVYAKGGVPNEQLARYNDLGWAVVCTTNEYVVIAAPLREYPTETYFGPLEESQLKKYNKYQVIGMTLAGFILCLPTVFDLCSFHGPGIINWRDLFEGQVQVYTLLFAVFFIVEFGIVAFCNRRKYIENRKTQGTAAHHVNWRTARIRGLAWLLLAVIAGALDIGFNVIDFGQMIVSDFGTEENYRNKGLFINVSNEEEKYSDEEDEIVLYDDQSVDTSMSLLIGKQCVLQEEYSIADEEAHLTQTYYELRTGLFKEDFMKSVLAEYAADDEVRYDYEPVKWQSEYFDAVYYLELEDNSYELIASKGNKMLFVNYTGDITSKNMMKMMEGLKWEK